MQNNSPTTVCMKCAHGVIEDCDSWGFSGENVKTRVNKCSAVGVRHKEKTDPVTGNTYYVGGVAGDMWDTPSPYPTCRDINKGDCKHFRDREETALGLGLWSNQ